MVIDIDIKIADNDGNLLHRFEKRFDDNAVLTEKSNYSTTLERSLEDFISKYLSFSGRVIREKLITKHSTSVKYCSDSSSSDFDPTSPVDIAKAFESNELEFKIRIGDRSIFVGKIPLKQQSLNPTAEDFDYIVDVGKYVAEMPDNCDAFAIEEEVEVEVEEVEVEVEVETVTTIDTVNGEAELESMINYALCKAIEKYEVNLYPSYSDINYEYTEAELDAASSPA